MHLNPRQPNILHDMRAVANGRDLHNPLSKRWLVQRKSYPYASERQVKRQQLYHRRIIRRKLISQTDNYLQQAETGN